MNLLNSATSLNWRCSFMLKFGDEEIELSPYIQELNLPSVSSNTPEQGYMNRIAKLSGESVTYSEIDVTFLVDDEYQIYKHIMNWIYSNSYNNNVEKTNLKNYGYVTVELLDSYQKAVATLEYVKVLPIFVSNLPMSTGIDHTPITISVNFSFSDLNYKSNT